MSNSPPSSIFRRYRLNQAAADGMVIVRTCFYCRSRRVYLPADLVMVYGDMAVEVFVGQCSKCGNRDGTHTRAYFPTPEDVGRMKLTRVAGWRKAWEWRGEWLELPLPSPGKAEESELPDWRESQRRPYLRGGQS